MFLNHLITYFNTSNKYDSNLMSNLQPIVYFNNKEHILMDYGSNHMRIGNYLFKTLEFRIIAVVFSTVLLDCHNISPLFNGDSNRIFYYN